MKWQSQICDDEIIRDWSLNSVGISFVRKFRKQYQLWIYGVRGAMEQPTDLRIT